MGQTASDYAECSGYDCLRRTLRSSSHAGGHWFESSSLHQEKPWNHNGSEVFSLPFSGRKEPLCLRYLGVFSGNFGASCCKSVANFSPLYPLCHKGLRLLGRAVCCKLFRRLPCRMPDGLSQQFAAPDFYDHSGYKHSASCPSCCVQPNTGSPLRPIQLQKDG